MKKYTAEFEHFERTARELLKVPHSEIKAKLERGEAGKENSQETKVGQWLAVEIPALIAFANRLSDRTTCRGAYHPEF